MLCGFLIGQSAQAQQVSKNIIAQLKEHFIFNEVVEISTKYKTRLELKGYFSKHPDIYHFDGSERQGEMLVDGYRIEGKPSVIGTTFFYAGEKQYLALINVMIHPNKEDIAEGLIKKALDSVDASTSSGPSKGGKLYWLGIYNLSSNRKLKIMLRSDIMPSGPIYSINYAISWN
jgi:hypothetical protein